MASETYEFLKKIAKGEEVNRWSYPDELINYISYTKGKSAKVEIAFDNDDDFLEILGVTDEDDLYVWRRFMGRYSYDYDFDMWRYEEDWKEGYVVDSFKDENIEITNKILKLIDPNLHLGNNEVDNFKIARVLYIEFSDEVSDITYEYGRYNEECTSRAVQKQLMDETNDPFRNFGIIQKQHAYKFVTSVNILLNLYKMLNAEDEDLKGMLKLLYENYGGITVGGWYDLEYNVWCDDYDTEGFQGEVKRNLNKMLEKVEEEFDGVDQEEFNKMYDKVMSLGGFSNLIDLPEKGIQVLFYKFDSKTNKLYFDVYKGTKKEIRSVNNLEDLNLALYHPELLENIRKILKKLL
jgi:hypothetical protein